MYPVKLTKVINPFKSPGGFTLVEVLLSVVLLGLLASATMYMYSSAYTVIDKDSISMPLDGYLRSRMELLVGKAFAELSDGSENVTVKGQNYTINWSVVPIDLDGDTIPEPTGKTSDGVSSRLGQSQPNNHFN